MCIYIWTIYIYIPVHAPHPPIRKVVGGHGDEVELDVAVGRVHFEEVRGFAGPITEDEADVGVDPQGAVFVGEEGRDEEGPDELLLQAHLEDLRGAAGEVEERDVAHHEEVRAFDHAHDHGCLAVVCVFEEGGFAHLLVDGVTLGVGDGLDPAGELLAVGLFF